MTIQEILARIHQLEEITNNTLIDLNNHFPYGDLNQVVVTNGDQTNTLKAVDVVSDGNFIVTDQELLEAKSHFVSQATIFNTWFRFSHGTNVGGLHPTPSNQLPGTPLETNSWVYNSTSSVITSTQNTPSFIGFVSPDQYHRYTHTVTLNAAIEDDDYLAVIIAFIEDKNDMVPNAAYGLNPSSFTWPINTTDTHIPNQHTLSLVRGRTTKTGFPLDDITEYAIVYNWNKPDQVMLANGNSLVWSVPNLEYGPNGNHTDVKIVREDDIITCYTTDWDDAPGGKGALGHPLQIDLTANPLTEKFRGSASYGYGALSQPYASYTNIYMNPNVNNIYDLRDGSVWLADNVGNYTKDPTKSYFDLYGVRRILHNPITKKTFYMRPDKQWELLSEAGNFITDITKPDPNVNTLRVFKGEDYFDIEITTGGSGSSGSGGGAGTVSRFGIEDNTSTGIDRHYQTGTNKFIIVSGDDQTYVGQETEVTIQNAGFSASTQDSTGTIFSGLGSSAGSVSLSVGDATRNNTISITPNIIGLVASTGNPQKSSSIDLRPDGSLVFTGTSDGGEANIKSLFTIQSTGISLQFANGTDAGNLMFVNKSGDYFIPISTNNVVADNTGSIILGSQEFADNASALAGGLAVGTIYRTGDILKIVH